MDYKEKVIALLNSQELSKEQKEKLENIFPELKESEDEKIRKEIIEYIKTGTYHKNWVAWLEKQGERELENYDEAEKEKADFVGDGFIKCHADFLDFKAGNTYWLEYIGDDKYNVRSDNLLGKTYHITPCQLYTVFKKLTWLEKQREQSADKVEPKFHEGEWLQYRNAKPFFVEEITKQGYVNGISCLPFEWEDEIHLWTIQDAKDGDVLVAQPQKGSESNEQIFLFKAINSRDYVDDCIEYYCRLCDGVFYENTTGYMGTILDIFYPATKEQRDLLFSKMKQEGYEWKQEEKKPIKMKETKFNVDDWIANGGANPCYVKSISGDYYELCSCEGVEYTKPIIDVNYTYHLWNIEDARDGDVVVDVYGNIGIFKKHDEFDWQSHCSLGCNGGFQGFVVEHEIERTYPATKEQRDLLFQRIADNGYDWDAKKKELKKIEVANKSSES